MIRIKRGVNNRQKHKKILLQTKGFRGNSKNVYRVAKEKYQKSLQYNYEHRKKRINSYRSIWITRLNAFLNYEHLSYSKFINNLNKLNIKLNRYILSSLAFEEPKVLKALINKSLK